MYCCSILLWWWCLRNKYTLICIHIWWCVFYSCLWCDYTHLSQFYWLHIEEPLDYHCHPWVCLWWWVPVKPASTLLPLDHLPRGSHGMRCVACRKRKELLRTAPTFATYYIAERACSARLRCAHRCTSTPPVAFYALPPLLHSPGAVRAFSWKRTLFIGCAFAARTPTLFSWWWYAILLLIYIL